MLSLLTLAVASTANMQKLMATMGKGINFGNSWDGNPNGVTEHNAMRTIINNTWNEGFRSCRFTVTWTVNGGSPEPASNAGGSLTNLRDAVSFALDRGFVTVVNWHWNHPKAADLSGFESAWHTIASSDKYFSRSKFPSERLMFEVLNEPNYNGGDAGGGGETATRKVNLAGYNGIRSADKTRPILVMPDNQGNWANLKSCYGEKGQLPGGGNDPNLAVAVHSYDPWAFAGDNNQGAYPGCGFYRDLANTLKDWTTKTGVHITVNEFGLQHQKRDSNNDHCYLSLMSNLLQHNGLGPVVWNDYGGFGVIDKSGHFSGGNAAVVLGGCIAACGCCP